MAVSSWPELSYASWKPTLVTLHRWMQIVGKIKLALTPRTNHFWNVGFTLTPCGMTTGPMPYGDGAVDIEFDLLGHELVVRNSDGETRKLPLMPCSVADFYRDLFAVLHELDIEVKIDDKPTEIQEEVIRFTEDRMHASYDREPVERCLRVLQRSAGVLEAFRCGFVGKASPVLFWWGTFDLAQSRYSGRPAPPMPNAGVIEREAYSHEVFTCGFWPGDSRVPAPTYFAYASPAPEGFGAAQVSPPTARFEPKMGLHVLAYDDVRKAADPAALLRDFFESTYAAAADLGRWDRAALERA